MALGEGHDPAAKVTLARSISLPIAVLFGLGVTIGAGIYVLIGAAAGRAGMQAPIAFILAAIVMAPTAASFAELAVRFPVSAGEAAYVRAGFESEWLARLIGFMVIGVGVLASAAISQGSAGYIRDFIDVPSKLIVVLVVLAMGAITAWGISQSAAIAASMTVIEIAGLLIIVGVGAANNPELFTRIPEVWTGLPEPGVMTGILAASLLAFFAFIGFEGLANIAEEVAEPARTLPRAIFLTLVISTFLYIVVAWVALVSVPRAELASASAPLSLVFQRVTGASPLAISAIAIVATINGVIAQIIMASRVLYGLADRQLLPKMLATLNPTTRTPLNATAVVVGLVLILATTTKIEALAEATSWLTIIIFAFVNAALVRLKWRQVPAPAGAFTVGLWVPVTGVILCVLLLAGNALR